MDIKTALDILELDSNATIDDVKKAHRRFITEWHPDKHANNKSKLTFAAGIAKDLNSARDCALEYLSQPISQNQTPPVTEQNAYDANHIANFIEEVCIRDPFRNTILEHLYFVYGTWCFEKHLIPLSLIQLEKSLEAFGFIPIRVEGKPYFQSVYWNGFTLNREWEEKITQIQDSMEIITESEDPDRQQQKEYSEMDDDDDLSEVVF